MEVIKKGLVWSRPDETALKEFLIERKGFSEVKVDNGLKKLNSVYGKAN